MDRFEVVPIPSCAECGIQSAGACPTCHRPLCMDHYGFDGHEPCASRLAGSAASRACYICGARAWPQQWSTQVYAHYVDWHECAGCHRSICDDPHTATQDETVVVRRDGVRSHRYHMMKRYCEVCVRLKAFGGLIGATWWLIGVVATLAVVIIVAQAVLSLS